MEMEEDSVAEQHGGSSRSCGAEGSAAPAPGWEPGSPGSPGALIGHQLPRAVSIACQVEMNLPGPAPALWDTVLRGHVKGQDPEQQPRPQSTALGLGGP